MIFAGMRKGTKGTSLIDLLLSVAIVALLFGGIYLVYFSVVTSIANISVRTAAAEAIGTQIEIIRNLPYASIGTVGGVPPGVIPQVQSVSVGPYTFSLATTILNIDDPFDGTVSGNPGPVDTAPADYKLVEIKATCPLCTSALTVTVTTTVAPKGLESATQNGSLTLYAVNANGNLVTGTLMHVTNASVTPSVNVFDTTNASGVLQLIGLPTSTQGYQIFASKSGYSSDQTYPVGGAGNPNPVKPNATVVAQGVTNVTLSLDHTSALTLITGTDRCLAIGNESVAITGAKLIGVNPTVYKFSTITPTTASGTLTLPALEWDTYSFVFSDPARDLAGTIPLAPLVVNPGTTSTIRFTLVTAANPSLLATVTDAASGAGIPGATITAVNGGYNQTLTAGHSFVTQSDWSGGQYFTKSSGVMTDAVPGQLALGVNASGTYNIATNDWLISNTFDLGGSNAAFYGITWNPLSEPPSTSVQFQVAANNDNATWNYVGPDGTNGSYFTSGGVALPAVLNGKRYFRYKVLLDTEDPNQTPVLYDVTFEFSADCVPPAQALFTVLPLGSTTVTASAPNYFAASTTVSVGGGWQQTIIPLNHI